MKRDHLHGEGTVTYNNLRVENVEFKMGKPLGQLSFKWSKVN